RFPRGDRSPLERFTVSRKRRTALSLCFDAIPDGKPLHTFPGIALEKSRAPEGHAALETSARRERSRLRHEGRRTPAGVLPFQHPAGIFGRQRAHLIEPGKIVGIKLQPGGG